ncbi:hypothetical protein RDI58_017800 [Solanum bulbocastanum]|uniref:Tf2-1-like SH3-like domain-containing protein n=1 Tax=Solanum bulbocastanum TaxID=147425 RepID=A0AAN8Y965_SOLBU
MKGVMRFGKKGKISPLYVCQYQLLRCVGKVAYEIDLQNDLAMVYPIFNVSMLKKFVGDTTYIVSLEGLRVDENITYEEVPIDILHQ